MKSSISAYLSIIVPGSPFRSDPIGLAGSQENCQIVCVSAVEHTVKIYVDLNQAPEQTFTMTCEQKDSRLCECPEGWEWDSDNEACSSGTCVPGAFIWNGIMYYHYVNGVPGNCPFGGVDNGSACDLGPLPSDWKKEGLIIDNCFFVDAICP